MRFARMAFLVGAVLAAATTLSVPADATLLVAAGGGGGAGYCCGNPGDGGQIVTSGTSGFGPLGGAGGVNGHGGQGGTDPFGRVNVNGGGGAGWFSSGSDGVGPRPPGDGTAGNGGLNFFFTGGAGGDGINSSAGGYGGGGGGGFQGGGGGGGYSGGGGGDGVTAGGGGGGSYIAPSFSSIIGVAAFNGVDNSQGGAGLDGLVSINAMVFSYTGSLQTYVVPLDGMYTIVADGAQGGSGASSPDIGGYGALMQGDIFLSAGTTLNILVGGAGLTGDFGDLFAAGGGGGSFVFTGSPPPLVTAPEPSSLGLFVGCLAGLGFAGYFARRRRA